jgi:eukaryotic translation initiation factor 2C
MFVGIALSRNNNKSTPTIAILTASKDKEATKYSTYVRALAAQADIVEDIKDMASKALKTYLKENKKFPKSVLVYRDGVPTNRFQEMLSKEVSQFILAINELKAGSRLTYIAFQKRHHTRLFPIDNNKDRSSNCLPGTVVDTTVTHPLQFNFILQSHAGLQGMSKPTLYHVVYDENKFASDEIQQTTFNLCFLSERATRAISVPAPAYRAAIAANCISN